jgi:hypothetical protein
MGQIEVGAGEVTVFWQYNGMTGAGKNWIVVPNI